jgi:hypothetical protein
MRTCETFYRTRTAIDAIIAIAVDPMSPAFFGVVVPAAASALATTGAPLAAAGVTGLALKSSTASFSNLQVMAAPSVHEGPWQIRKSFRLTLPG